MSLPHHSHPLLYWQMSGGSGGNAQLVQRSGLPEIPVGQGTVDLASLCAKWLELVPESLYCKAEEQEFLQLCAAYLALNLSDD